MIFPLILPVIYHFLLVIYPGGLPKIHISKSHGSSHMTWPRGNGAGHEAQGFGGQDDHPGDRHNVVVYPLVKTIVLYGIYIC